MSEEIQKLDNVDYKITEEVLIRKWAEVYGKRNKLLSLSDWTHLVDTEVPQNIRNIWKQWRQKVRRIKKSTVNDPNKAMDLLKSLEKSSPEKLTIDLAQELPTIAAEIPHAILEDIENLKNRVPEVTLEEISNIMNERIKLAIQNATTEILQKMQESKDLPENISLAKSRLTFILNEKVYFMTKINPELHNQAIDYLIDPEGKYPLLKVHADYYGTSLEETANAIIHEAKQNMKKSCELERKRLEYLDKIEVAESSLDLINLHADISGW